MKRGRANYTRYLLISYINYTHNELCRPCYYLLNCHTRAEQYITQLTIHFSSQKVLNTTSFGIPNTMKITIIGSIIIDENTYFIFWMVCLKLVILVLFLRCLANNKVLLSSNAMLVLFVQSLATISALNAMREKGLT